MAGEDKEKAEKLAAAKKRFEQLKKEQQKKGKKGDVVKKKEEKVVEPKAADEVEDGSSTAVEQDESAASSGKITSTEQQAPVAQTPSKPDEDVIDQPQETSKPVRQPSVSLQSKQRSVSFRQGSGSVHPHVTSDSASPASEVHDLHLRQAAHIEKLERENKGYKHQQEEDQMRLATLEEELQSLQEDHDNLAELQSKARDAERCAAELTVVQRQLAQAQQDVKGSTRRISGPSSDLSQQLASKTATIETLELELSTVRNQLLGLQSQVQERGVYITDAEERIKTAEAAAESYKAELDALKVSLSFPADDNKSEDPEALNKRITVLESDLRTANNNLDAAARRATTLEQKIEAITKLHRDTTTASATKDRELSDLRAILKKRDRPSHVRDASDFELGEEESETGALQARIRALEAEVFDLWRGVWREKRADLQPGIDEHGHAPEYEDVDLHGPASPHRGSSLPRQSSTFQDVLTSGISAFTGRAREQLAASLAGGHGDGGARGRGASLGLLDEEFDEEAFRLAQEEEAKRRVERVKEVKRGLEKWKGWRMDLVEMRREGVGGGRDWGPVFEV